MVQMMNVFVSGSQHGGTQSQLVTLEYFLSRPGIYKLITGGCTGVDEAAVEIMVKHRQFPRWGHIVTLPASDVADRKKSKVVLGYTNELHAPAPALERNLNGALMANLCLFVPKEPAEILRSGTWSAYRRAQSRQLMCIVIRPDGTIGL